MPRVRCCGVALPVNDEVAAEGDFAQGRRNGADGLDGCVRTAEALFVRGIEERPKPIGNFHRQSLGVDCRALKAHH